MPQDPSESPEEPDPCPSPAPFTLAPLVENGPDALPPDKTHGIAQVKLSRLVVQYDDALHQVVTSEADDLLKARAPERRPLLPPPNGANVAAAGFKFLFDDGTEPNLAEIRPPNHARLKHRAHAEGIAAWFVAHQYACCSPAVLVQLLTSLLLALILATAGCITPGDDDDDSDDEEPTCLPRHR